MNCLKEILKKLDKNSAMYFINAGWFVLPLIGTGDKKGLSVSISILSIGMVVTISLKFEAFLNVAIPDNEFIKLIKNNYIFFKPAKFYI